jgi:hypothetical protein
MSFRPHKLIITLLLCVSFFLAWRYWSSKSQKTWFDFIEKQCVITQDMIDHPPDGFVPTGLALRLEFLMGYYEAHSRSLKGSPFESVATRDYQQTLTNAIALFRRQTTNDLGGDPRAWIEKNRR